MDTPVVNHSVGADKQSTPTGFSDFNWLAFAWKGARDHMEATLTSQYEDSNVLELAANLVQEVGSSSQTFKINAPTMNIPGGVITNPHYQDELNFLMGQGVSETQAKAVLEYLNVGRMTGQLVPIPAIISQEYPKYVPSYAKDYFISIGWGDPSDSKNFSHTIWKGLTKLSPNNYNFGAQLDQNTTSLVGNYTIAQLIAMQGGFSQQGGSDNDQRASTLQSLIGQAQSQLSQNVQIAQQYVTQETNAATSSDPQATQQAESEQSALNNALSQWVQLTGSFTG